MITNCGVKKTNNYQAETILGPGYQSCKIFDIDLVFTESNNFTFGIGSSWIRCKTSIHLWVTYGIQMLLFIYIATPKPQVSKFMSTFKNIITQFITNQYSAHGQKTHQTIGISAKFNYFLQSLKIIQTEQSIEKKIKKICELVNLCPQTHQIIVQYINNTIIDGRKLCKLNQILNIDIVWDNYPKKIVFNSLFQCLYKFSDDGIVSIKIQDFYPVEKVIQANHRLVRKSTVQSVGEMSEDEDHQSSVIQNEEDEEIKYGMKWKIDQSQIFNDAEEMQFSFKWNHEKSRETLASTQLCDTMPLSKSGKGAKFEITSQYELKIEFPTLKKNSSAILINSKHSSKLQRRENTTFIKNKFIPSRQQKKKEEHNTQIKTKISFRYFSPINSNKL